MCMSAVTACIDGHHLHVMPRNQKRGSDPLELELQIPVSCQKGAKDQTQVLCKNISVLNL